MANPKADPVREELLRTHPETRGGRLDFMEDELKTNPSRYKKKEPRAPRSDYVAYLEEVKRNLQTEIEMARTDGEFYETDERRRQRRRSYADALAEKDAKKMRVIEKVRSQRKMDAKIARARMATSIPLVMDTRYPAHVPGTAPGKHADSYHGPSDPEFWGIRGENYKWHRTKAQKEAVPMSQLTLF